MLFHLNKICIDKLLWLKIICMTRRPFMNFHGIKLLYFLNVKNHFEIVNITK